MSRSRRQALELVEHSIQHAPGFLDRCAEFARVAQKLNKRYRDTHDNAPEDDQSMGTGHVVDPSQALVILGDLREISYATAKGRDGDGLYWHPFEDEPFPKLCYGPDDTGRNGLVIVRPNGCLYDIEPRGIVG